MYRDPEQLQVSPPEGWKVADETGLHVSLAHDELDVEVIVEEFEMTEDEGRSRSGTAPARTVFEVGYRPADVEAKSIHVSTVESPEVAERLIHEAISALDE